MNARRPLGRKLLPGILLLLAAAFAAAWVYAQSRRDLLDLGVGYGARVACACRYIGGRSLESCYRDFEPGMEAIWLSDDARARAVTAYVPLVTSRTVRFDPELGCQPEPYRR